MLVEKSFMQAQAINISGEYKMNGNQDMVSVFVFQQDSSFEYYFLYGAVDRKAHRVINV
jgi:hypothetical protein